MDLIDFGHEFSNKKWHKEKDNWSYQTNLYVISALNITCLHWDFWKRPILLSWWNRLIWYTGLPFDTMSRECCRHTGQSLSSFVTVTNKLGDETIVVLGGWLRVSIDKRNHDSFWLYWLRVSMLKRNHIENEVVMVATESQTNFAWSIAISMGLIMNDESYLCI